MKKNTLTSYSSFSKLLHWLITLLVIFMLGLGYIMDDLSANYKYWWYNLHKSIGISILFLMLLRLYWRRINPQPKMPVGTAIWEHYAAKSLHLLFYFILLLMPLAGWVMSTASGNSPRFFWLFRWPLPIAASNKVTVIAGAAHATLAWVLIIMIMLHVLAACKHHFVENDNTLTRMLPVSGIKKEPISHWEQTATQKNHER